MIVVSQLGEEDIAVISIRLLCLVNLLGCMSFQFCIAQG